MSEFITENQEDNLMHALMEEIEKSLRLPRTGEIVTGEVIQVSDREVVVNLGCKKDGIITRDELTLEGDQKLTDLFKEGDEIQAKVIKTDNGDGNILLSKKKLEVNEHWDEINAALEDRSFVNVKVVKEVNGGVIASYKEVFGFIPLSQLSDRFVESAAEFVGKVLPVRVTRVDQKKGKAVFSHKAFLVEEKQAKVAEIWEGLNVGDVVEGTVMRFTDYGAFVDIGGLDGLLHISEISWGKLKHPQEVLSIGESYKLAVGLCYQDQDPTLAACDAGSSGIPAAAAATDALAAGMTVANGVITMTGTAAAGGYTSVLTPAVNAQGTAIVWTQSGTCLAANFCKN